MKNQIHQPYQKLKGALRAHNLTYSDVAEILRISETSVSHKINGRSDFYLQEVIKMVNYLDIHIKIFLP